MNQVITLVKRTSIHLSSNSFGKTVNVNPRSIMSEYDTNNKVIHLTLKH